MARYSIEEYVRWEDIDAAGIINYQAYLRFFALAEAELLRSAGLHYRFLFESLGIWLPRVRVECNFYRPVKLDELLVVEAYFSRIGRTSIQLDFEVRRKTGPSETVATGRYVHEAVSVAVESSLEGARSRRKVGRCSVSCRVGVAGGVHCDTEAFFY